MAQPTGIHARRAALRLLDAVLRRGETLDIAFGAATKDVRKFEDKALARAIASEVLRWLVDLDALVDSATKKPLPDDAKARMVLRMMLAQWLRPDTPPHAVIATCLPLLAGGPRRLAHGVFSTLTKREETLPAAPTLPADVAERWGERAEAVARGLAEPPPLDLTLKDPSQTEVYMAKLAADSLIPGHLRLARAEQAGRQRGGEVLHPPFTLRKAGKLLDREPARQADMAGRKAVAAQLVRPMLRRRMVLQREVEWRRFGKPARDGAGTLAPARRDIGGKGRRRRQGGLALGQRREHAMR